MTRFADLNPATMPGYGDPETWGGRTPYVERPDDEDEEAAVTELFLREKRSDEFGSWWEEWYTKPPAEGVKHRVTRSEWNSEYRTREIYAVEVVEQ